MSDPIQGLSDNAKVKIFNQVYSLIRSCFKIVGGVLVTHGIMTGTTQTEIIGAISMLGGLAASAITEANKN